MKINKYLTGSFDFITKIEQARTFQITIGRKKNHAFNGRTLNFNARNGTYNFDTTTEIRSGLQTLDELYIGKKTVVELKNPELTLYLEGLYLLPNSIGYSDINNPKPERLISGELRSISNRRPSYYKKKRLFRMILPIKKKISFFGDFTGFDYSVNGRRYHDKLLKLEIAGFAIHTFTYQDKQKKHFIVIDAVEPIAVDKFQEVCNSILLSYAFLKGDYHGELSYIFTFENKAFKKPVSITTNILAGGIYSGFEVHTSKPHRIINLKRQRKDRFIRNDDGKIIGVDNSDINKYMVEFPMQNFSNLCNLVCEKGGVQRAIILFVSNHSATLELKVPTLFVALENVAKVLTGADKTPAEIIGDEDIKTEIKQVIKDAVKKINKIKRENKPNKIEEEKDYNSNFSRIIGKLYNFNAGTNNKKLQEPFDRYGYELSEEESDLIFTHRNKFIHGHDFMSLDEGIDKEFKELFHMSLRLQKVIAVLLLKACGFSGYILNQAKIHEGISGKSLKEPFFIKI